MSGPTSAVVRRPSYGGSAIALLAALCVPGVLASHPLQLSVLGVEAAGGLLLLGSGLLRTRGRRASGYGLLFAGSALVCLALALSVAAPLGLVERAAFVLGTIGVAVVLLGLYPLRANWARSLAGAGVALLGCSVVLVEWVAATSPLQLLLAVVLLVASWDAAEHAIALGDDVGRSARSARVSIVHARGTVAVGVLAVAVAIGVDAVTLPAIPVAAIALLLGAALLLLAGLYVRDHY